MTYEVVMQEQIKVWQNITVVIDTEDTQKEIYNHIQSMDFLEVYRPIDFHVLYNMFETDESMEFSY